jgi:hypothetical protein
VLTLVTAIGSLNLIPTRTVAGTSLAPEVGRLSTTVAVGGDTDIAADSELTGRVCPVAGSYNSPSERSRPLWSTPPHSSTSPLGRSTAA